MEWSFDMLPEPEQDLLRRLSVFPQNFDLDAAAAVAGDDADALDVLDFLARLVDKSLLVPEGFAETARYRLLETVRQYAAEKLAEAGGEEDTRTRHRRHFMGMVESAYRSGVTFNTVDWARQAASDAENYTGALETAVADGDLEAATVLLAGRGYPWFWGAPVPSFVDSINPEALTCSEPSLQVEALFSLAAGGMDTGRWGIDGAIAVYERARTIADQSGTRRDQGFARYYLGYLERCRGDGVRARRWMEDALDHFGADSLLSLYAHYELGWIDVTDGDAPAARHHFQRSLALIMAGSGFDLVEVHVRAALALVETMKGNAAVGSALAQQALETARSLGLPGVVVMALVRAAETAVLAGTRLGPEIAEVLRLLGGRGTHRWVAAALTVAALDHEEGGRPDVAARLLGGAAGVADALEEDPLPLPAIAALVVAARTRLVEVLGTDALAEQEAIGRSTAVPELLRVALDQLGTEASSPRTSRCS